MIQSRQEIEECANRDQIRLLRKQPKMPDIVEHESISNS